MSEAKVELFNIDTLEGGIFRKLAEGLTTTIFPGEKSMLSIVKFEPGAIGKMHNHPEEQWGFMLEGDGVRYQDDVEFAISKGDFWRTPPHAMHTMKAGDKGAVVLDIFAPAREAYRQSGEGFGD